MGLGRRLVRRSIPRSVRRATHPVRTAKRAVTPKPLKHLQRDLWNVAHPVGAAENALLDALFSGHGSKRRPAGQSVPWGALSGAVSAGRTVDVPGGDPFAEDPYAHLRAVLQAGLTQHQLVPRPAARVVIAPVSYMQPQQAFDADRCFFQHRAERMAGLSLWRGRQRAEAETAARADTQADAERWSQWQHAVQQSAFRKAADERARLDTKWQALHQNDPDEVLEAVEPVLADLAVPIRPLRLGGASLELGLLFPSPTVLPDRRPEFTPTGRPTVKPWGVTSRNQYYLDLLASSIIAAVRRCLAAAPALKEVAVAAARRSPNGLEPICWAVYERSKIQTLNWADPVTDLLYQADDLELNPTGRFEKVLALPADEDWPEYLEELEVTFADLLTDDVAP